MSMDWASPYLLLLIIPAAAFFFLAGRLSLHPMPRRRRRLLQVVRGAVLLLALIALAGPAYEMTTDRQSVLFVMDHSKSQGADGMRKAYEAVKRCADGLPGDTFVGVVSAGASARVLRVPERGAFDVAPEVALLETDGAQTNLEEAVELASCLFPPGAARSMVLVTDGLETRGDLERTARKAAASDIVIHAMAVAGKKLPDVRVVDFQSSRLRSHEGAAVSLTAHIESSISGIGRIRLFENGIEVETRDLKLEAAQVKTVSFKRTPEKRNLYNYMVRVEGFDGDAILENNESLCLVEVRGRPLFLYVEGEPRESHYLCDAMAREGIRLEVRPPDAIPESLQEMSVYDGLIFSDIPAYRISEGCMTLIQDYVEQLGGGFLMIGGKNSFGVGGYYRTPIEEMLPVKMKAPDKEEIQSVAIMLVIDRSGSMGGQKIEICKSAAVATLELLHAKDFIGVVCFNSSANWVVPMTSASKQRQISGQIKGISSGGGTNMQPGMAEGYQALKKVSAKIKHMIVLTDGQTSGGGYESMAAQMKSDGITVSSVGVGNGAAVGLLRAIAAAGDGEFYFTADPRAIPQIFTQDTMKHMGRLIRENNFVPEKVEQHPMLKGWPDREAPPLMGYVKTHRRATSQVPLVTDLGDPLLATWRFGLGKVTAFTSDCKSRWSSLWIASWPPYSQFWAQVLRETAREPQGRYLDIRLAEEGKHTRIVVEALENAATFKNNARIAGDVFFVPANALTSSMKNIARLTLDQKGPGRYEATFMPDKSGVYLVRARSEAEIVSAGFVHNISREAAVGTVDRTLLEKVTAATGGLMLSESNDAIPALRRGHARFVDLYPTILKILLLLFLVDIAIRRWDNIVSFAEWIRGR